MEKEEKIAYWLDLADYDMATAFDLYTMKRWLYVGFMCHQVIEKTLKAYWSKTMDVPPPYIHNLAQLAIKSELYAQFSDEQQKLIALLMPMNIEARYPEYKAELTQRMTQDFCKNLLENTKDLQLWIKNRL